MSEDKASESKIEAAAERWKQGGYDDLAQSLSDSSDLADWAVARLAADRAERDERDERSRPIDAEWLESIGFANTGLWMSIRVGPVELTWDRVCGLWVDVARPLSAVKTRGQLLDLLRVLKGGA